MSVPRPRSRGSLLFLIAALANMPLHGQPAATPQIRSSLRKASIFSALQKQLGVEADASKRFRKRDRSRSGGETFQELNRTRRKRLHYRSGDLMPRRTAVLVLPLVIAGCSILDQHRSVTKEMGWQCTGVADIKDLTSPHVESIKMWFLENPNYEVRASGPHLCADLKQSGKPTVTATFDVWGNRLQGLHGYNLTDLAIGATRLQNYEADGAGFHDNRAHFGNFSSEADRKQHPEFYRFPLDVFKN